LHGFWVPDDASAGRRWYRRSDGSHQYIIGNTHYTFLTEHGLSGKSTGGNIAADMAANAKFFKKVRFGLQSGQYPHPTEKPWLDDDGRPTDDGNYSHRPNPRWFHQRVDLAVRTAFEHDLIADLILAGPDTPESRTTLKAKHNAGDATPYLRYIAARYGSFPNVWLCLCNEYDIKNPKHGQKLGQYFWGCFDAGKHTAADNLGWLRETIDREITFWKLAPAAAADVFPDLDRRFRVLAWPDHEYVLGTDAAKSGIVANLGSGHWIVTRHDVIGKESLVLAKDATGRFAFDAPACRAVLFHFRKGRP